MALGTHIFDEIDRMRRAKRVSENALCLAAGVSTTTYWRVKSGFGAWRPQTERRLRAALAKEGPKKARRVEANVALVRAAYRGHLAYLAAELGFDPKEVVEKPYARAFWKTRALALWCVSVELDIRGAVLGRALGLSKQIVSWNIKQAEDLLDDPALAQLAERAGRLVAAREG